jgi:hypothetical protein
MPRPTPPYRSAEDAQDALPELDDGQLTPWFRLWRLLDVRREQLLTGTPSSILDDVFVIERLRQDAVAHLVELGLLWPEEA